jgi:hypothetical protein
MVTVGIATLSQRRLMVGMVAVGMLSLARRWANVSMVTVGMPSSAQPLYADHLPTLAKGHNAVVGPTLA